MSWNFYNPVKINLGRGSRKRLNKQLSGLNILVVTTKRGRKQFSTDDYLGQLAEYNRLNWLDSVQENPDLADLQQQINAIKSNQLDAVIAFGGGSAIDAAKAVRLGLACQRNYQLSELIAQPDLHKNIPQLPLYALPTTSGTGSEVTPFATVWDHTKKKKLSLSSDQVFPSAAFVDADLTEGLPISVTLSTGLDAINQAAESVWNKNANPLTLTYATRALKLALPALPKLIAGDNSSQHRDALAEASLLAGLAISHTRTALCHSISYPLTAHFGVPHGLACAFTMPAVCTLNIAADDGRFSQVAQALFNQSRPELVTQALKNLNKQLKVTEIIKTYISSLEQLLQLQKEMFTPGRADNNLSLEIDLKKVLLQSWYDQI